jgi:hypothetical protein
MTLSLHTLPIELVYRILDNLDYRHIFLSCRNVCRRLNGIIDTYHRYKVIIDSIMALYSYHLWSISFFSGAYLILMTFFFLISKKYIYLYPVTENKSAGSHTHIIKNVFNFMLVHEISGNTKQSKNIFQRRYNYWFEKMPKSESFHNQFICNIFNLSLFNDNTLRTLLFIASVCDQNLTSTAWSDFIAACNRIAKHSNRIRSRDND